jgi:hypothetical protein
MIKEFSLAVGLAIAAAGSAYASSSCSEPIPPVALDGSKATLKQVSDASHDTNLFMKASDDYQLCLRHELDQQKAEAARSKKPLDPSIVDAVDHEIDANQSVKERVGGEFQAALLAFCKANPTADPSCKKILGQ